jgi:CrcB protein
MIKLIAVFIGGGLGSACRYGIAQLTLTFFKGVFPLATLLSNVISSLILAGIIHYYGPKQWDQPPFWYLLLAVGFCGGFSTFSTFGLETFELIRSAHYGWALLNVLVSIAAALFLFFLLIKSPQ